jgi:hypothetical protein
MVRCFSQKINSNYHQKIGSGKLYGMLIRTHNLLMMKDGHIQMTSMDPLESNKESLM